MLIFKRTIVIGLCLFALVHTLCTLLHVLPSPLIPSLLKEKAGKYMAPLFGQTWNLFAPVPPINKNVYVSYLKSDGQWSKWDAPFSSLISDHQANCMSPKIKLIYTLSNDLYYLYYEHRETLKKNNSIMGDTSAVYFKALKGAIRGLGYDAGEIKKLKLLVIYQTAACDARQVYAIYYPYIENRK